MPNRSDDYFSADTSQWLKMKFPGLQNYHALVEAITEEVIRAYGNGRDDGFAAAAEEVIKDLK